MKPLTGITIIEFSTMVTASFATMMMAEQGARAIKVEPVDEGDPMRGLGTKKGGMSGLFANCNRGKESVSVNLKDARGLEIARRLVSSADVVISNFRPGVMDALGLGSADLRTENPRLIYMAVSGFGVKGPLSAAPAYDPVIQAHAGFTATQGQQNPEFVRNLMCDKITAYTACQAVTAALYQRSQTGAGQHIDLSMLDAGLFFLFPDGFMQHTLLDEDVERSPDLADLIYDLTLTRDGAVTIAALTDEQRVGVAIAAGLEHLNEDERFNSFSNIVKNLEVYREILSAGFIKMDTDDVMQKLTANDVPCARCHTHAQVLSQEQVQANGTTREVEHPITGKMLVVHTPAMFGGERLPLAASAPGHGQHTQQMLEELGYNANSYAEMKAQGVVG